MSALSNLHDRGRDAACARFKLSASEKTALARPAGPYRTLGVPSAPPPAPSGGLMRGLRNTGLAVGAGALGASALGLGHERSVDNQQNPLVYQPMSSGYGT